MINLLNVTTRPCWDKIRCKARTANQAIQAVLLYHAPNFGGPGCALDGENRRVMELLGPWPDEVTAGPTEHGKNT